MFIGPTRGPVPRLVSVLQAQPLPELLDVSPLLLGRPLIAGHDLILVAPVKGAAVVRAGSLLLVQGHAAPAADGTLEFAPSTLGPFGPFDQGSSLLVLIMAGIVAC